MIKLRNWATAFLYNNGNYLLMKRAENRAISPGLWSGIGGHMESAEINNPRAACLREIQEETGIEESRISRLRLLYIIIRRSKDEIRQSYIYFGETTQTEITQTDEGAVIWINEAELLRREYSKTLTAMLLHYTRREPGDNAVYAGAAESGESGCSMCWAKLEDFDR